MKPFDIRSSVLLPTMKTKELFTERQWRPYPRPDAETPCFSHAIDENRYQLYTITANLLPFVLSGNLTDSPLPGHMILDQVATLDGLSDIEQKILKWYRHLPAELKLDPQKRSRPCGPLVNMQ
jgi:hypothetical protein